jgi:thiol-disulfide isomerase/thioredoxin
VLYYPALGSFFGTFLDKQESTTTRLCSSRILPIPFVEPVTKLDILAYKLNIIEYIVFIFAFILSPALPGATAGLIPTLKKTRMKNVATLLLSIAICTGVHAQRLEIGDHLPDTVLDTIVNYSNPSAKLSEFSNKPTIISFWSRYCTTCIGTFKKMDSLKAAFGNRISFIAVNSEVAAWTRGMFKENKVLKKVQIPSVTGDSVLHSWFPHKSVPHLAWIDNRGIVQAITSSRQLTSENLQKLAGGGTLSLEQKYEEEDEQKYWAKEPIITYDYNTNKEKMLEYSYLSRFRTGFIGTSAIISSAGGCYLTICINKSLKELYKTAYQKLGIHETLVFFDAAEKYEPNFETKENLFCYNALTREKNLDKIKAKMQFTLDSYFGLKSGVETREVKYYGLEIADSSAFNRSLVYDQQGVTKRKIKLSGLTDNYLSHAPFPVVNETGYNGIIEIGLPDDKKNFDLVKQCLLAKGLRLVEKYGKMECLVIQSN